jgi:pimeloyl-ACP methyl ester carboxylesterase
MHRLAPLHAARLTRLVLPVALGAAVLAGVPATASAATCEPDVAAPSGGQVRVCMPQSMAWNNDVVIYAHGYVEANRPLAIPAEQLCLAGGAFCLPDISNALGFAFVTTSYRSNGIVLDGVADILEALDKFKETHGVPRYVYLVGASEGGLVTTLGVEQHPDVFAGGLAACGPIGDFDQQVAHYADFRVLFDYFFPGLMPGSVEGIPDEAIASWDTLWNDTLKPAVFAPENASKLQQLLKTSRMSYMPADPATIELAVHDGLWYNIFATNDLIAKLGGEPYDNTATKYMGSADDTALNAAVQRVSGDAGAFAAAAANFQTSGHLAAPLVNLHTWMDQQVPFRQEILYTMKVRDAGALSQRVLYPVYRYGHCNFTPVQALLSFAILIARVMGAPPAGAEMLLPDAADRQLYLDSLAARGYAAAGTGSGRTTPGTMPKRQTTTSD